MSAQSQKSFHVAKREGRFQLFEQGGIPVGEANLFLGAVELRGMSPLTVRAYAFDLLVLYRWLCQRQDNESKEVTALKPSDLVDFVRFQRQSNAAPASINRRLTVTYLFYLFLTGKHLGAHIEVGRGVSLPPRYYKGRGRDRNLGLHQLGPLRYRSLKVKMPRTLVTPLTSEQVRQLIRSFRRYRDLAIVYLMLLCGLRSQEELALQVSDVEFNEHRLRVLGKGKKERVLPLPTILMRYLRDYLHLERPLVCKTESLFVLLQSHRRGKPMTVSGLRSLFRHRRRSEKIENANPHRLRHTFGADMARCGVTLPVLQKLMGHADSKMTLRYINLSMTDIITEFRRAEKEIQKRYTEIQ